MARNPLKLDPSRTTTLRKQMLAEVLRRFKEVARAIVKLVDDEDAFGLKSAPVEQFDTGIPAYNVRGKFSFSTDADKIDAFNRWLKKLVAEKILGVEEDDVDPKKPWTGKYIQAAHRKGVSRGYDQVKGVALSEKMPWGESRRTFLKDAFAKPEMLSKVRILGTRTYESLKGITAQAGAELNRSLALGLAQGKHPTEIARGLVDTLDISRVRADRLARTEIIHAHAEGQLDSFEELGIEEVGLDAELITSGDEKVCPICHKAKGVYTVAQARGVIPLHPNCRCGWKPHIRGLSKRRARR